MFYSFQLNELKCIVVDNRPRFFKGIFDSFVISFFFINPLKSLSSYSTLPFCVCPSENAFYFLESLDSYQLNEGNRVMGLSHGPTFLADIGPLFIANRWEPITCSDIFVCQANFLCQ